MFTIPITLPSTKTVRIPEFKNKHYLIVLKFCENNDIEGLCQYFKHLLFEEFKLSKELNFLDLLYVLIYIRTLFVDPKIHILNEKQVEVGIELNTFLEKLEQLPVFTNEIITLEGFKITIGLPTEIYFGSIDEVISTSIKEVEFYGKKINLQELSHTDRNLIIEKLPLKVTEILLQYMKDMNKKMGNIFIVDDNPVFHVKGIELSILSNQFFYFIKSIYSQNLRTFFELMYHFTNKVNHSADLFMELTPVDSMIMFNMYREEVKNQNEDLKSSKM